MAEIMHMVYPGDPHKKPAATTKEAFATIWAPKGYTEFKVGTGAIAATPASTPTPSANADGDGTDKKAGK